MGRGSIQGVDWLTLRVLQASPGQSAHWRWRNEYVEYVIDQEDVLKVSTARKLFTCIMTFSVQNQGAQRSQNIKVQVGSSYLQTELKFKAGVKQANNSLAHVITDSADLWLNPL